MVLQGLRFPEEQQIFCISSDSTPTKYRIKLNDSYQRRAKTHQRVANEIKTTTNTLAESTFNFQLHQRVVTLLQRVVELRAGLKPIYI